MFGGLGLCGLMATHGARNSARLGAQTADPMRAR